MKTGDAGKTGSKDLLTAGLILGGSWLLNEIFGDSGTSTQQVQTWTPEQKQAYEFLLKRIYGMFPEQGQPNKNAFRNMPQDEFNRVSGNVLFGGNQASQRYFRR